MEYERCLRIWRNWVRSAPEEIITRIPHFNSMHAYHSVKLEYPELTYNNTASVWSSSRLSSYTGDLYPIIAVHNHKVACRLAEECLKDGEELSVDLLCGLQHALSCGLYSEEAYVIDEDRPGEFKQSDKVSSVIDVGSSPDEIEHVLTELIDDMPRVADMNDTLVAAAYLHARLIFLRPFAVANGPVCRLVTNYWLRMQGHPPVLIPSGEALNYHKCLEMFDVHEDIEPLAVFLSEKVVDYWSVQMSPSEDTRGKPLFTLKL